MIARITGKIIETKKSSVLLEIGEFLYEVLLPLTVIQRITEHTSNEGMVSFITYHYYTVEPSRSTPVLIGFLNEVEKEFFEAFITVSGIGPRAALKALNQPISLIAQAIDEGNIDFLKGLPGIGQQKAKEIVAKLQNKVGKFGLIQDREVKKEQMQNLDIQEEVLAVLTQLGYRRAEASLMIKKALDSQQGLKTTEELLNEVYRQKRTT
ncbi:MAG: Holliday junction branch migration protein RuvA [Candidatus Omnitrophota bacterium]